MKLSCLFGHSYKKIEKQLFITLYDNTRPDLNYYNMYTKTGEICSCCESEINVNKKMISECISPISVGMKRPQYSEISLLNFCKKIKPIYKEEIEREIQNRRLR